LLCIAAACLYQQQAAILLELDAARIIQSVQDDAGCASLLDHELW
jgi:hypothetical protein